MLRFFSMKVFLDLFVYYLFILFVIIYDNALHMVVAHQCYSNQGIAPKNKDHMLCGLGSSSKF